MIFKRKERERERERERGREGERRIIKPPDAIGVSYKIFMREKS